MLSAATHGIPMVGRPPACTSLVSRLLPGAVPGASKPGKLLLQYSVWLSLRVDGHGSSGGRWMQVRCRGGSPGAQSSSCSLGGDFITVTWPAHDVRK